MSKTGKTEENFKDKLKGFFRIKEKSTPVTFQKPASKEFIFTAEILKDIGPESPANNRLKTIKELGEVVRKKSLEDNGIEALWHSIADLLKPQAPSDNRRVALEFLEKLLEGQLPHLGILRAHFFNVICNLTPLENLPERLCLFKILSENGRNLLDFEEEAGLFLLEWMPEVLTSTKLSEFLELLVSVIKFNAAYLDEDVISGLVKQTCMIPNRSRSEDDINKLCLDVLDAVVCYSYLPCDCLQHFIGALCRMVNMPKYCEPSWELMRKLLGTHLGHSSVFTMCTMLQDKQQLADYKLLRGAVFYVGMALWGSRKVTSLKHTPAAVLPSFLQVLSCSSPIVCYEVVLSVQRLVKKYGKDLTSSTWHLVLDIVETVIKHMEVHISSPNQTELRMHADLHDVLSAIENLHEHGQFSGSVTRFFKIIEMCASKRPESSVSLLIQHHAQSIHPGKENWITSLYQLLDKYFRNDSRTKIRVKALDVLSFVLSINKHMYEDDLINHVVLPHLSHIESDPDSIVRKFAVDILLSLAHGCNTQCFMDLIGLIEKIMNRPLVTRLVSPYPSSEKPEIIQNTDETHLIDVRTTVLGLVDLFKTKLYMYPSAHCSKVYYLLVGHMSAHYSQPKDHTSNTACVIRKSILECLLQLRSDSLFRFGFADRDSHLRYSPYVVCKQSEISEKSPPVSPNTSGNTSTDWYSVSILDYTKSFTLFIQCLENEKDWEVLKCVLENLPLLLQNKTIVLSVRIGLVETLSQKLCSMVNDRQLGFPEKLLGVPAKFNRSDFHSYVFPVLAAMVTYHNYLDRSRQRDLIKCLEFGMVSKCAKMCVNSLRLCTLEMSEVMMRQLPMVLLQLSKINATVSMAIPALAFLSSIVRLPKMYANFVEDEYMSVFAIALPYTNPFKFSHYTVSLAHHVIAIWFIKCRLPFRKGFVKFIQKGLKSNVLQQFEENSMAYLQSQNQDSSDRVRAGSYSETALRTRRRMVSGSSISRREITPPVDEKMSQFHRELTETCTDVMARYTFGNFSALPHRSHMADFLLSGGQTQTWLLGNKLITITTSGGGTKVGNSGLCEKCMSLFQSAETKDTRSSASSGRRRHKSAVTFSRSSSTIEPSHPSSQDDTILQARCSLDDINLPYDLSEKDVAVQTGSSLHEHSLIESEPLESLLLASGLKSSDTKGPIVNFCNCWCTNWAEVHIRAPSGNLSWMMRIENDMGMLSVQDSQVPDITMLFASMRNKRQPDLHSSSRIESGSVGEEEYETLYKEHFPEEQTGAAFTREIPQSSQSSVHNLKNIDRSARPGSLGFSMDLAGTDNQAGSNKEQEPVPSRQGSEALQIPKDSSSSHDPSTSSLRRSNSSPSILSGSSDTLSPRESVSDSLVQFGWVKDKESGSGTSKSPDSDTGLRTKELSGSEKELSGSATSANQKFKGSIENQVKPSHLDISKQEVEKPHGEKLATPKTEASVTKLASKSRVSFQDEPKVDVGNLPPEYHSMLSKQLSPSPASSEASSTQDEVSELPTVQRLRGHTISVVSPSSDKPKSDMLTNKGVGSKEQSRVGISPSFVFLQLYHGGQLHAGSEVPVLLPQVESINRSVKMLDHIYPYETHKIGVIYVGPGQTKDEKLILSNQYGSERYATFVQSLGQLLRLKDCNPERLYLGGLDTKGSDGDYAYGWHDESVQLIFHVATLMPNKESDPNCNAKKLHIGNDYVTVVYNESDEDYRIGTIKGQFNYVNIVIKPLDDESNAVTLQAKEVPFKDQITTDIAEILGHKDTKVISDSNLAALVRQIAVHCNLASMVLQRQASQPTDPFASNWLERLRQIKRIQQKVLAEGGTHTPQDTSSSPSRTHHLEDFTDYV